MLLVAFAQLLLVAQLARFQDEAPPPPPIVKSAPPIVPGEMPASASAQARTAWLAMVKATSGATAQARVTGFDLRFDGRARPVGRESHDFNDARYRYSEPGWVHMTLKDGSARMRGPRGDWFIKDGIATRLQGADFANDARELDEQARIASSFISMIDLRAARLQSLALATQPPPGIPPSLLERARQLRWLETVSPHFEHLEGVSSHFGTGGEDVLLRAWIGVDATTNLPQLAMVARDDHGTIVHETASLFKLDKWRPLDGIQVPYEMRSFEPDLSRSPWVFNDGPSLTLWLKPGGTLRPALTKKDFLPPAER